MHELQFEPVGVVEEHGVIPKLVTVRLRTALDLGVVRPQPLGPFVYGRPGADLEGDVVDADAVAVEGAFGRRVRLAQAERGSRAGEVVDRLAALALDLVVPVPAERAEQLTVEGQAALDRRDDEVEVMDTRRAQYQGDFSAGLTVPLVMRPGGSGFIAGGTA